MSKEDLIALAQFLTTDQKAWERFDTQKGLKTFSKNYSLSDNEIAFLMGIKTGLLFPTTQEQKEDFISQANQYTETEYPASKKWLGGNK